MFATYFVSASFEQYDIRVSHLQPTALGRLLGYKAKWIVQQCNGRWGMWFIDGIQSGSTPVEIGDKPIRAINGHGYLWMDYHVHTDGNVVQNLNNGEYSIFDALSLLTKEGEVQEILEAAVVE